MYGKMLWKMRTFPNRGDIIHNTSAYVKYDYEDSWIVDPFVKEMIQDVDKSTVLDCGVIDSPVLGKIPPTGLSGGVKTIKFSTYQPVEITVRNGCLKLQNRKTGL